MMKKVLYTVLVLTFLITLGFIPISKYDTEFGQYTYKSYLFFSTIEKEDKGLFEFQIGFIPMKSVIANEYTMDGIISRLFNKPEWKSYPYFNILISDGPWKGLDLRNSNINFRAGIRNSAVLVIGLGWDNTYKINYTIREK